jgi:predicted nucleotide-binding protein
MSAGTRGEWDEQDFEAVKRHIWKLAGEPSFDRIEGLRQEVAELFADEQSRFESLTVSATSGRADEYIDELREKARTLRIPTKHDVLLGQLPKGPLMSRDSVAVHAGVQAAPHQDVYAEIIALHEPFVKCKELARLCRLAADHLERAPSSPQSRPMPVGTKVFIGHGRSGEWRKLKDFLQDRLRLEWDEFNRVPVAGVTNISRLQTMLGDATIAFLVMTAEDEQVDGSLRARENVVHEAGLFQGRLGFERAIVMLEEPCEPFSNIDGLGQLRFPRGRIEAIFEDVRAVLEREELISRPEGTA